MLPSLLTELDQLLLVSELNIRVFNGRLDPALVRIALTTPSACLDEDYQRLELLGDGFLKWLASGTSLSSFSEKPAPKLNSRILQSIASFPWTRRRTKGNYITLDSSTCRTPPSSKPEWNSIFPRTSFPSPTLQGDLFLQTSLWQGVDPQSEMPKLATRPSPTSRRLFLVL